MNRSFNPESPAASDSFTSWSAQAPGSARTSAFSPAPLPLRTVRERVGTRPLAVRDVQTQRRPGRVTPVRELPMDLRAGRQRGLRAHERSVARSLTFAQGLTANGRRLPLACEDPRHALLLAGRGDWDEHRLFAGDAGWAEELADGGAVVSVRPQDGHSPLVGSRHLLGDAVLAERDRMFRRGPGSAASNTAATNTGVTNTGVTNTGYTNTGYTNTGVTNTGYATGAVIGSAALSEPIDDWADEELADSVTRPRLELVTSKPTWTVRRLIVCGVIALVAVLFSAVALHAVLAQNQVGLDQSNRTIAQAEAVHDQLRVEVARLEAPSRIASEAARLGLSTPHNVRFIPVSIGPDGGLTVIEPPVGATEVGGQ